MPATTLIEDMQARLATLAPAGGVFYGFNTTEPAVYPYIVWNRVTSTPNVALGGPSDLQNTRVQIDIVARRISEAVALETALEASMAAWSVQNVPLSSMDVFEDEIRAFRVIKDYSVWARN